MSHAGLIGGGLAGAAGGGLGGGLGSIGGGLQFLSDPLSAAKAIVATRTSDQASSVSSALAHSYSQGAGP